MNWIIDLKSLVLSNNNLLDIALWIVHFPYSDVVKYLGLQVVEMKKHFMLLTTSLSSFILFYLSVNIVCSNHDTR